MPGWKRKKDGLGCLGTKVGQGCIYIYMYIYIHKEEDQRDDCRGLISQLFALSRYVQPGCVHDRSCVPTSYDMKR